MIRKKNVVLLVSFLFFPLYTIPWIIQGMIRLERGAFVFWACFMGLIGILYPPVGDVYQYTKDFYLYKDCSWDYFLELLSFKFDYLLPFLSYFIGLIGWHFDITRFIYNFFSYLILGVIFLDIVKNNHFLRENKKVLIYALGTFITFSFITYLWRFGFSSALFVYGCYLLVYKSKRIGWIYVVLSVLNHVSFLLFVVILLLQQLGFFKFHKWVVAILCLCSLFLDGSILSSFLPYLPTDIVNRFGSYIDGYYATDYFADHSWKYQLQVFLSSSITYVAVIAYILTYKERKDKRVSLTNAIFLIACLSLPFDTMRLRFLAVLLLFIKMCYLVKYDGEKKKLCYLKIMFFFVMLGNVVNIWGARRQIDVSDYELLFYYTTPQIILHTYSAQWIERNVTSEGDIVKVDY